MVPNSPSLSSCKSTSIYSSPPLYTIHIHGLEESRLMIRMLLGMYYNGYILFAIFIGHTVGYLAFARDTAGVSSSTTHVGSGHCC
jgi:hypothetical protein